jgi:hypothetical protein
MKATLKTKASTSLALTALLVLGACGKAQEAATEKVIEKVIESQLEKDGSHAKVDLSNGQARITTTDAQGQASVMEMGGAKVDASEVGLPFYPGAQVLANENQRVQTPEMRMVMVALDSTDSVEKIGSFYRDKLRALSAGKTMMDNSNDQGVMMVLVDANNENSLVVNVTTKDDKQRITLTSSNQVKKK